MQGEGQKNVKKPRAESGEKIISFIRWVFWVWKGVFGISDKKEKEIGKNKQDSIQMNGEHEDIN